MMSRKFLFIGLMMLSLGFLGMTGQAMAATAEVTVQTGAAGCTFSYITNCAYNPNPLTINSGDSVHWTNEPGNLHTATSDGSGNSTVVIQPAAPGNEFSTELMFPGASSTVIGPFNTAVNQTKLYHCSLHPTTMGGTLNIMAPAAVTTTTTRPTTTTTTSTTTTTRPITTTSTLPVTTTTATVPVTTTTATVPVTTTTATVPVTTTTATVPVTTTTATLPVTTTTQQGTTTSTVATTTTTVAASTTTTTTSGSTTTTVVVCRPRPGAGPCPSTTTTTTVQGISTINSTPRRPGGG